MCKNFWVRGFSLNFRALTFSLNMKNSPYHIESVTCEDQVGCTALSQVFRCRQYAIFLKSVEVGQLSVQAETLYSINLHQLLEDWSLHVNYQYEKFGIVQRLLSQIVYSVWSVLATLLERWRASSVLRV